jgi:hypothetical protein
LIANLPRPVSIFNNINKNKFYDNTMEKKQGGIDPNLALYAKQRMEILAKIENASGPEKEKLELMAKDLLRYLNTQGLCSDEQMKEDPTFWAMMRLQVIETQKKLDLLEKYKEKFGEIE